jgi:hypothetical protein
VVLRVSVPKGAILVVEDRRSGRLLGVVRPFGVEEGGSYRFSAPDGWESGETLLHIEASWPGGAGDAGGPPNVCVEDAKLVN